MRFKRREFMVAATAAVVIGCETASDNAISSQRPRPDWLGQGSSIPAPKYSSNSDSSSIKPVTKRPKKKSLVKVEPAPRYKQIGLVSVLSRTQWTRNKPNMRKINAMGKISRITLHHSGMGIFTDKSYTGAQKYLEKLRGSHTKGRGWSDIGYHFAIDPNGRVWECRNLRYQGAHVSSNNENNVGVLLMGNFEKQRPSRQQLATMKSFVRQLRLKYGVPVKSRRSTVGIKTHRELGKTACPGRYLQPYIARYRDNGSFA